MNKCFSAFLLILLVACSGENTVGPNELYKKEENGIDTNYWIETDKPFTGKMINEDKRGKQVILFSEGKYVSWEEYNSNNEINTRISFVNGNSTMKEEFWYKGRLRVKSNINKYGEYHGVREFYEPDGTIRTKQVWENGKIDNALTETYDNK